MLSFDAHYDIIAKKITKWEGRFLSKNCHFSHPLILLFFELHEHNIPQMKRILVHN